MTDPENSDSVAIRGTNIHGGRCPRCGYRTHKATFNGETWYRCVSDHCPRGWYCAAERDHGDDDD